MRASPSSAGRSCSPVPRLCGGAVLQSALCLPLLSPRAFLIDF